MPHHERSAFGSLLRRFRLAAGLSQEGLAKRSKLSLGAISAYERGVRRSPYPQTVAQLAEALDLSPQQRALFQAAASRPPRRQPTTEAPAEKADAPGAQPEPSPHQLWASTAPALVGRAQELAWLQHEIAAGRPLSLLSGEPGIGKTRLLSEAMSWARRHGWRVLSGECRRSSGQEPYAPLIEALERSIRFLEPERLDVHLEGCGWLTRLLPELADAGYDLSAPTGLSSAQERRQMFMAVERYLSNIAGRAGTLLVLDDLQWAGADALDLLEHLIRSTRIKRLRILGAFRSTEAQAGLPFSTFVADLGREDLVGQVELGPLEPDDALALASNALAGEIVGGGESALAARVVEHGGGVPWYLVNYARLVQALGEGIDLHDPGGPSASARGARRQPGDPARARSQRMSKTRWEVPWAVKQSTRERVAALPHPAQDLLDVVAVIGQQASAAVLAAGAEQSEAETITGLEIACQAGLLVEDPERGQAERYRFAHDLIRDVVEADLSVGKQTLLHRRVAAALEQRLRQGGAAGQATHLNDRALAQVAYHYARADMPEQEARYLRLAGDHAQRVYAHREAAQHYLELIACLDRLRMRREAAQARKDLAVELARVGRFSEAVAPLDEAEQICRELGDAETLALVTMVSGQLHVALGASDKGLARVQPLVEAYSGAQPFGSPATSALSATVMAQLQGALSGLSFMAGHYQDALQAAERAVELAQATGDVRLLARQHLNRGVALFTVGRLAEATERLEDAIMGADAVDDLDTLAEAFRMAIWVYQTRGMFAESQTAQTRGLDVAQRLGDVVGLGHILFLDALRAFYVGEWDRARAIAESALAVFSELDMTHLSAYPPLGLGWLSTIEGDRDIGERYLAEAEEIAEQSGPAQVLRFITALRAECELLAGRAEAANQRLAPWFAGEPMQERTRLELNVLRAWAAVELDMAANADELVTETVRSARASDMRLVLSDALRVQALWAMRRQRWDEAGKALDEAIGLGQEMPYPYAEAKALYVSGQLWAARGKPARAEAQFEEALAICQRLGERLYGEAIAQALSDG
jgi:transcriptional regulator with XRE-family HTH domain/tetratricopeptide (TPR) repeat protein